MKDRTPWSQGFGAEAEPHGDQVASESDGTEPSGLLKALGCIPTPEGRE